MIVIIFTHGEMRKPRSVLYHFQVYNNCSKKLLILQLMKEFSTLDKQISCTFAEAQLLHYTDSNGIAEDSLGELSL